MSCIQVDAVRCSASGPVNGPLLGIDASSWISGLCYALGFALSGAHNLASELNAGGVGLYVLVGSALTFLAAVGALQRYMHVSLLANSFGRPQCLVTEGPFRLSRNPIYVAFFLPLASLAYFSAAAALLASVLYVTLMTLTVIRHEERQLEACFGSAYLAYKARTRRWL